MTVSGSHANQSKREEVADPQPQPLGCSLSPAPVDTGAGPVVCAPVSIEEPVSVPGSFDGSAHALGAGVNAPSRRSAWK